jgi:quercetin dioxygenase-like cupin family protein
MTATHQDHQRHVHVPSQEGRLLRVLSDIVEIKLSAAETNGAYMLFEIDTPPEGGASVLHTHEPQETFYVLDGTYEFGGIGPDGPYVIRATAGAAVQIPAGAPHGYKNVGETPARALVLIEPPGQMQALFEELHDAVQSAEPLTAPPTDLPTLPRILEIFTKYGVVVLPPAP